jgi:pSer/pThr/pTyr-binding forkhead associated (FHA) protein
VALIKVTFNNEEIIRKELKDVCVIGRQEGCDIHIDNLGISRNHTRILREGDGFVVEDMNSSNGTYLNGTRVERQTLNDGDEIAIGKYVLTYVSGGAARPAAEKPKGTQIVSSAALPGGGALNTMSMDGDEMRKRIEEMRRQKEEADKQSQTATKPETPSVNLAEIRAREAEMKQLQGSLKKTKLIIALVTLAAIAAVVYFLFFHGAAA